jgi:hypothetical protein
MDHPNPVVVVHPGVQRPAAGAALVIFVAMIIGMAVLCALALSAVSLASGAGLPL